jgi:hypothetical protein
MIVVMSSRGRMEARTVVARSRRRSTKSIWRDGSGTRRERA